MEIVSDIRTETNEEKPKKNDPKIVINEMTEITCKNFVGGESVNSEGTEYKISNDGNEKGNNSNGQNIKDYGVELGGVDEVDCKSQFYSEEDGEESLFFVDNKPSKHYKRHEYAASAPQFSVDRDLVDVNKEGDRRNKKPCSCWNCGDEGHSLRECKLPRNMEEIAKNRKAFMENPKRVEFKRYHVEMNSKYSNLKPGVISDELREALGLSKNQLPSHIYAMRTLGYPPGWLLEAKISSSTLEMYDINGKKIPDPDDEEGEIESVHDRYDLDMIVRYPGFNVVPPSHFLEESYFYHAPLMDSSQHINVFISSLKGSTMKNKRTPMPQLQVNVDVKEEVEDMEAEDIPDTESLPEDDCRFVPAPPSELPPPPPPEPDAEGSDSIVTDEENTISSENVQENGYSTPPSLPRSSQMQYEHFGKVKSVYMGTPVYNQHSPYTKVPSYEMFGKGIGDVISFENLPESSGAYEKMNKLIRKVRNTMAEKSNSGIKKTSL